jgi:hypothetical protein
MYFRWLKLDLVEGIMLKEWSKFTDEVTDCAKKSAKRKLGINLQDEMSKEQSIELVRLRFRCYYETLQKMSDRRFSKLIKESFESIAKPSEILEERRFKYLSKFHDPRDLIKQKEFLRVLDKVALDEIAEAVSIDDTGLTAKMFVLSFVGNIINQVYLGFIEPLIDLIVLANKSAELDADWATALIAVSLEEALIKKKLRELSYDPKKGEAFHKLVEKLVELLKREDVRPAMDVLLSNGFRNIRHEIIHDPTQWKPEENELNEIIRHTIDLAKALWPDLFISEQ